MKSVTVQTNANISLIKYWGKRDESLFLPTKSSLIVTLSELKTTTTVAYTADQNDHITMAWESPTAESQEKITAFIDLFRRRYQIKKYFTIHTHNNFPTGAGLASSSSGFAALALGLTTFCNLDLAEHELSILARQGSGSACRSISGGIVLWHKGNEPDGSDCYAEQILDEHHWPDLRILVVIINNQTKPINSRNGMYITTSTSKTYHDWLIASEERLKNIIPSIKERNIDNVGSIAEADWTDMHRTMLDSTPSLSYWNETSYTIMNKIRQLRAQGIPCYFTTEAGPNIKILCLKEYIDQVKQIIISSPGVIDVITCSIAGKPRIHIEY
jgi:diphosphomevalonate decarboxylase